MTGGDTMKSSLSKGLFWIVESVNKIMKLNTHSKNETGKTAF